VASDICQTLNCGGSASIAADLKLGGCTITLDYPGSDVKGGVEFGPGAACADIHRAVRTDGSCLPRHLRHFEPSFLELNEIQRRGEHIVLATPSQAF